MRVIELNRHLVWEQVPIRIVLPEAAYQIGQRRGDQEVFLHEAQCLTHARGVVRIEYPRERLGSQALG